MIPLTRAAATIAAPGGRATLAVVADTHSHPHPDTNRWLAARAPAAILHAGDIGELTVLDELATIAPVYAIRGNIDGRDLRPASSAAGWRRGVIDSRERDLPDVLAIDVGALRLVLVHIGVAGPRLRADAAKVARAEKAQLVVCGHSHVPFMGAERGLTVFNPGSIGPRRFNLPITFGMIEVAPTGIRLSHVDAETGRPWTPP